MSSRFLVKLIVSLIFVVLIGTPLFYLKTGVYPYILSKTIFFQGLVEILFSLWLVLIFADKRFRPTLTPLLKALLIFLAVILLTSVFGVDFHRSFWSTYERMFGVNTILHLAALAVIISSLVREIPWRKMLYASLTTAFIVDVLATIQARVPNLLLEEPGGRPGATFGNPTFLAGYLLFHIFIALYFLVDHYRSRTNSFSRISRSSDGLGLEQSESHRSERQAPTPSERSDAGSRKGSGSAALPYLFFAGALVFSLIALLFTETRGDMLGLAAGFLVFLALLFVKPPDFGPVLRQRWIYGGLVILIVLLAAGFWFTRTSAVWSKVPGVSRFSDISASSLGLQPRIVAIRSAWKGFLDRPILGWGWENFNVVYNKYYDPRTLELNYEETRFDKPHNFFMEDLSTGGTLLVLAHLWLLALLAIESLKIKDRVLGQIVFASITAYFVRSIFIFDTIGPALMLYVLIGLVDGWSRTELSPAANASRDSNKNEKIGLLPASLVVIVSSLAIYQINIPTLEAAHLAWRAFGNLAHGRPLVGVENFRNALDLPSPYRWNFARDFSAAISTAYFYNKDAIPQEAALQAIREMERVVREHPTDAYNHYTLVDMYNQVSDLDQNFLNLAEKEGAIALELSPNRQEVYFSLAKTKTLKKDYAAALDILRKALVLDDKVPDAHFYYGVVAYADGDYETGYKELKASIALKRQWRNFYEPRTTADFFADSGHIEEAIELYKQALELGPDEIETKIKLGTAYFYANKHDLARKYLEEAGKKFDFKKSASYGSLKPILDKLGISS